MITDVGKEIISKFLLGQTPAYATHIAIGCGASPLDANDAAPNPTTLAEKTRMDFEMTRIPITSRGFVDDNGTTKVSFTAELPKENRYEITEIGLWSSGSNSLARTFDSRMIFNFSESWQAHSTSISEVTTPSLGSGGDITTALRFFRALSSDSVFSTADRKARREGPRFLDSKILLRGDSSVIQGADGLWSGENPSYSITNKVANGTTATLTTSTDHYLNVGDTIVVDIATNTFDGTHVITARTDTTVSYALALSVGSSATTGTITWEQSTHIHLNAINFDISKNAPSDKILLAFSLIDKDSLGAGVTPDHVKILLEFYRNETSTSSGFAKAEIYIEGVDFTGDRYKVVEIPISSLITTSDFSSEQIRTARIFSSVIYTTGGQQRASSIHYVELEGIRLENETTENPLYGMPGYSVVRTTDGQPLYKFENTNNYIEFRFNLEVG